MTRPPPGPGAWCSSSESGTILGQDLYLFAVLTLHQKSRIHWRRTGGGAMCWEGGKFEACNIDREAAVEFIPATAATSVRARAGAPPPPRRWGCWGRRWRGWGWWRGWPAPDPSCCCPPPGWPPPAHTFYFPVTAPSLPRLMCNVSGWWCSHHIRSQLRLHRYRMQCTTLCNICQYFPNFCKKSVHLTVSPGPKPGAGLWSSAYPSLHLILATTTRLEEWHVLRMGTSAFCSKYLPAHKSILP